MKQSRRRGSKESSSNYLITCCVLTLSEVATYLRLSPDTVLELVKQQGLPARQIGPEWRFLRSAIDDWLRGPQSRLSKDALLSMAGTWKEDLHLDELVAAIYEQRGRPMPLAE